MDRKAEIRAEMEKERKAGIWSKPSDFKPENPVDKGANQDRSEASEQED